MRSSPTEQWRQLAGKRLVYPTISVDLRSIESSQVQPVMKDRPQSAVRKAQIVLLVVLLAQRNSGEGDVAEITDTDITRCSLWKPNRSIRTTAHHFLATRR